MSNAEHAPKKKSWFGKAKEALKASLPPFETRPLLDRLKWGLTGGTTVAWLHSSILFPSLAIATGAIWATRRFLLKDAHHGGSNGSSRGGGHP